MMDREMTWTVLYKETDDSLKQMTVDAPHGAKSAWDFIEENYNWTIIAIVSGMHDIYHAESRANQT